MQKSNRIAEIISYLFHPLLMPLIGIFIIFNSNYTSLYQDNYRVLSYMIVLTVDILILLWIIPFSLYWKFIENIKLSSRSERFIPFFISAILYFVAYVLFVRKIPLVIVPGFIFSVCVTVFLTSGITLFWKISTHMAGIGGIVGLIIALSMIFKIDLIHLLIIAIFTSGIIAYARLKLDEHNTLQIYSGFILGMLTVLLTLLYYYT